jgi:cytoskeletal protein CcmA (bactofilin family)
MAFLRGRSEDESTAGSEATGAAPTPAFPASTPASLSAFIDQGSEFEGKLTFKDTVRIDGVFRGEITSQNTLIVGETGEILATVRSRSVLISGTVTGDVFASERLVLHKTARVDGDVEAGTLAIEEGAVINGKVTMGGSRPSTNLASVQGGRPAV